MRVLGDFRSLQRIDGVLDIQRNGIRKNSVAVLGISDEALEDVRRISRRRRGPVRMLLYTEIVYPESFQLAFVRMHLYPTSDFFLRILELIFEE